MSDHTSPFEGSDSPSRQRSPTPGDPKYHYESLNDIGKSSATSAPYTRRRPSRTSSGSKGTPPSASPPRGDDHDESEQRNKPPRNTLKKLLRRDSHHTDTGSTSQGKQEELDEDGSTIGYMPRLGQIKESKSKVSTRTRRRGSSVVSSSADAKVLRRRHTGDNAVKRSHTRDKRSSLQRHAGNMANMSDPSLVSSVTQQSDVSGDSNSTVLQRPYSGYDQVAQYLEPDESHSPSASTTMESPALNSMNATQPAVFQYLQSSDDTGENFTPTPTDLQAMPPSTIASSSSSSSSGDIQHDDGRSSVAADSQHTIDSPMTSPASTRRSFKTSSHLPNQGFRKFKKPLYASSFVHGPGEEAETNQEEGSDESGSGSESEEEVNQKNQVPNQHLTGTIPPRAPSTSSRQSDPHASRLKQQERELANHILQAPQPYQDYQYGAEQPAYNYPPMPMYSPQGYSGASPAAVNAAVSSPPGWAPMASFPAPLAIGKVSKSLEQAPAQAVQDYREWMDEHDPVDETESSFLEQDDDLVIIGPRKPAVSTPTTTATATSVATPTAGQDALQSAPPAITLPLLLILPLVAFAIVPSLLGRIIVIGLTVGMEGKIVRETPQLMRLLSLRDWSIAAVV
ncbi:unnamed protein product [Alternaria alternata]